MRPQTLHLNIKSHLPPFVLVILSYPLIFLSSLLFSVDLFASSTDCTHPISITSGSTISDSVNENKTSYYSINVPEDNASIDLNISSLTGRVHSYIEDGCGGNILAELDGGNPQLSYSTDKNLTHGTYIIAIEDNSTNSVDYNITAHVVIYDTSDICYSTTSTSGLFCGGFFSVMCTTTTPLQSLTDTELTDVQAVLGTSSLFSAFSDCGVDGTSGNCENSSGMSIMMMSAFNNGIHYTLPDYSAHGTHTTFTKAMFSFMDSGYDWAATYKKNGVTHIGKLSACEGGGSSNQSNASGKFNIIETTTRLVASDPQNGDDPKNALYTKIVSKDFNISLIHLKDDNTTLKRTFKGFVALHVAHVNDDGSSSLIQYDLWHHDFTGSVGTNGRYEIEDNLNITKTERDAKFKIDYIDWDKIIAEHGSYNCVYNSSTNGNLPGVPGCLESENKLEEIFEDVAEYCLNETQTGAPCKSNHHGIGNPPYDKHDAGANKGYGCALCLLRDGSYSLSRDNFAIRPDRFEIYVNNTSHLIAGKDYNITFKALKKDNNFSKDYNESAGISFQVAINETKTDCKTGSFSPELNTSWSFSDGNKTLQSRYSEIGKVNIKISEINGSEFAIEDRDDTNDSDRLITPYDLNITFIPHHFELNASLKSAGDGFTYISSDLNMSATLDINATAQNEQNSTTTNYNSTCYAKDTNYTISYLTDGSDLTTILYKETLTSKEGNKSLGTDMNLTDMNKSILFATDHNGTASLHVKINFDRNISQAVNPFKLTIKDINATDSDTINGAIILDKNAIFLYGRTHAPTQILTTNEEKISIYYEAYCSGSGCNKSLLPNGNTSKYIDDPRWFRNTLHASSSDGVTGKITQRNRSHDVDAISYSNTNPNRVTLRYNASDDKGYPYTTTMENNASSWLIYNKHNAKAIKNRFQVTFVQHDSKWAGKHETNTTTDTNASDKTNRRLMW